MQWMEEILQKFGSPKYRNYHHRGFRLMQDSLNPKPCVDPSTAAKEAEGLPEDMKLAFCEWPGFTGSLGQCQGSFVVFGVWDIYVQRLLVSS